MKSLIFIIILLGAMVFAFWYLERDRRAEAPSDVSLETREERCARERTETEEDRYGRTYLDGLHEAADCL